jgi:histidine triad (HIT) family protein
MNYPFAAILDGKDRSLVIAESDHFVAVLDKKPLVLGHTLIISKRIEDHLFDLSNEELGSIMQFAKSIAAAIRTVAECKKVGVAVIGLETRHAHMHLVPINSADDLNFTRVKLSPSEEELAIMLEKIKNSHEGLSR